jgi:NAD(P) transhydrogenase subunit alpha
VGTRRIKLKIGVPKEIAERETRVAIVPSAVSLLKRGGHEVIVESGAGQRANYPDEQYKEAGAVLVEDPKELYRESQVVLKVQAPRESEVELLSEGCVLIGFLSPVENIDLIKTLAQRRITSFALEFIPRITRAQNMDALSSMGTVVGYKAVLLAADHIGKFFPLLMTAAGTIYPANVLVLGAGVAGLQAIATAKRLGARVEAFDPRPAVREQVESLGAHFVEMELPKEDIETKGGYAKEMSEEFLRKEQEAIAKRLPKMDVVITTAAIFGKRAPILITEDMVKLMPKGSVIVDVAASTGGNCQLTVQDKVVEKHGVVIFGETNLAALLPYHASEMYARNLVNLLTHLYPKADSPLNFEDEIIKGACVTRGGAVVSEYLKNLMQSGG